MNWLLFAFVWYFVSCSSSEDPVTQDSLSSSSFAHCLRERGDSVLCRMSSSTSSSSALNGAVIHPHQLNTTTVALGDWGLDSLYFVNSEIWRAYEYPDTAKNIPQSLDLFYEKGSLMQAKHDTVGQTLLAEFEANQSFEIIHTDQDLLKVWQLYKPKAAASINLKTNHHYILRTFKGSLACFKVVNYNSDSNEVNLFVKYYPSVDTASQDTTKL